MKNGTLGTQNVVKEKNAVRNFESLELASAAFAAKYIANSSHINSSPSAPSKHLLPHSFSI